MADQLQGSDEVRLSARRRLIKGSFAAPAALTLFSGGAVAATSNTCVVRAATSTENPAVSTGSQTESGTDWLRVRAGSFNPGGSSSRTTSFWISYASVDAVDKATTSAGIVNTWTSGKSWCVESGWKEGANNSLGYSAGTLYDAPSSGGIYTAEIGKWYLVLVDTNGRIVGIGANHTNGGNSVSASCWSSFKLTP